MIRRELAPQPCEDVVARFMQHYEEHHAIVRPFPGITEMLDEFHHRGIPMALVTGKGRGTCEITIRQLGWSKYFRRIISGHDVEHQKPHPEGALSAAEGAGVSPEYCAFIGDSPADIRTGQNAGMTTIAAAWHPIYIEQLKALNPDHFASTPDELINLFQKS